MRKRIVFYVREGARLVSVLVGGGLVIAGLFSLTNQFPLGVGTVGAIAGILLKRRKIQDRDEVLTWKSITGWSILGGAGASLVLTLLALSFGAPLQAVMERVTGTALGAGVTTGVSLSLVNWGWRGPLPDDYPSEELSEP